MTPVAMTTPVWVYYMHYAYTLYATIPSGKLRLTSACPPNNGWFKLCHTVTFEACYMKQSVYMGNLQRLPHSKLHRLPIGARVREFISKVSCQRYYMET